MNSLVTDKQAFNLAGSFYFLFFTSNSFFPLLTSVSGTDKDIMLKHLSQVLHCTFRCYAGECLQHWVCGLDIRKCCVTSTRVIQLALIKRWVKMNTQLHNLGSRLLTQYDVDIQPDLCHLCSSSLQLVLGRTDGWQIRWGLTHPVKAQWSTSTQSTHVHPVTRPRFASTRRDSTPRSCVLHSGVSLFLKSTCGIMEYFMQQLVGLLRNTLVGWLANKPSYFTIILWALDYILNMYLWLFQGWTCWWAQRVVWCCWTEAVRERSTP